VNLLASKTALVYGGSGAVGGAVARAFAWEGARVVLVARRRDRLAAMAEEIRAAGGRAEVAPIPDAKDPAAVKAHLDAVTDRVGPITTMFSAIDWGDVQGEPLGIMGFEKFMQPVVGGLTTLFHTGTLMAEHMAAHGGGSILTITANAAKQPFANIGGFGVACAAAEHFMRQLAAEYGPQRVRACWVRSPGSPDAPGVHEVWEMHARERGISFEDLHREYAKDIPLRRVTGLKDVANAVVLLASDLAGAMTATAANATGGGQMD